VVQWDWFPRSDDAPEIARSVVEVFRSHEDEITSSRNELQSNQVLAAIAGSLQEIGFRVESGKTRLEKIHVPVLFGRNGAVAKAFDADAWHLEHRFVLEVEAGRGVVNNQFLKDLFQACMMHDVDYLAIAVRIAYRGNPDFQRMVDFFETLYTSNRMTLPLKGILTIGY
jgi:hypothetical protein